LFKHNLYWHIDPVYPGEQIHLLLGNSTEHQPLNEQLFAQSLIEQSVPENIYTHMIKIVYSIVSNKIFTYKRWFALTVAKAITNTI
jgi:hypothetical protein